MQARHAPPNWVPKYTPNLPENVDLSEWEWLLTLYTRCSDNSAWITSSETPQRSWTPLPTPTARSRDTTPTDSTYRPLCSPVREWLVASCRPLRDFGSPLGTCESSCPLPLLSSVCLTYQEMWVFNFFLAKLDFPVILWIFIIHWGSTLDQGEGQALNTGHFSILQNRDLWYRTAHFEGLFTFEVLECFRLSFLHFFGRIFFSWTRTQTVPVPIIMSCTNHELICIDFSSPPYLLMNPSPVRSSSSAQQR